MSTPGTRKSASLESTPSNSSRTAPPTTYASSPSDSTYFSIRSDDCDRLDLDERARWQLRDLDRRPGRRGGADVLCVHLVHPCEIIEVLQEDRRLDDLVERRAGCLEDRPQICEELLGLGADLAALKVLVPRLEGELARNEDEAAGLDRLRVRRPLEWRRRRLCAYRFLHDPSSSDVVTRRQA